MNLRHTRLPLLLALIPAAASAQILAGGGEISLGASLTGTYDSNFSARADSGGGYYGTFSPSAAYTRSSSIITTNAELGMGIERYVDHTEFNQETYHASGGFSLEKGTLGNYSLSLKGSFSDGSSANYDLGQRLKSRSYGLVGDAAFDTSERTGLSFSTGLSRNESGGYGTQDTFTNSGEFHFGPFLKDMQAYATVSNTLTKSDGRNLANIALNQSSTTCSLGLGKNLSEKVLARLNIGYNWHNSSQQENLAGWGDSSGTVISASLTGPFLPETWFPKTKSGISLTYSDSNSRGIYDTGGKQFGGNVFVTWQARENTDLTVNASRTRRLTLNDRSAETTQVSFGVNERLTTGLLLNGSVGYSWNTYPGFGGGSQNGMIASASAHYGFGARQQWGAGLSFNYNSFSSGMALRDYSRYSVSASLSYKY